ncbi:MAG: glycosyltransferase [Candidatus Solibacter sp.]
MSTESAALARAWVERCAGIVVLVAPSVDTALTAASAAGSGAPRLYILDCHIEKLAEIFRELVEADLAREATMFHGSPQRFMRDVPAAPGLVIVEGASLDARTMESWLLPGVPVIALAAGVCDAAVAGGALVAEGPESAYRSSSRCQGSDFVPSERARIVFQGGLHERYFGNREQVEETAHDPELIVEMRREAASQQRGVSGRGPWPFAAPDSGALPRTLPSGKPWPKISIVTPTFNQGAYIEGTILSVLHQGYPNVEHIVMDGGSSDGTLAVLERYRDRLALVRSEPDNGQSHAINKGMAIATGEILTWLNSDDMLAPGALAAIALAFDTHECDMVAGICRLYRNGALEAQHITSCTDGPLPLEELLDLDHAWNAGQFFYQPEVMFTRDLWQRAGGYVHDWRHYTMDYEMWLRFAEAGARLHVIGRPVAWFRLHELQKTHVAGRFKAELLLCRTDFLQQRGMEFTTPLAGDTRNHLRLTLLNDIGPFYGAGIAHVRMARALAWAGHQVSLVSILDRSPLGVEATHYTSADVLARVAETQPDLVIVGNLHAAGADAFLLHELCEQYPVASVMHDFWAITGRCVYPGDCEKYLTGCDHTCPTADEYPVLAPERIAQEWRKKRMMLGSAGPALLMNSAWTAAVAQRALKFSSATAQTPVAGIRPSFPLEIFRPRDRRMCRELLGLPEDAFIVLVAGSIINPREGGPAFLAALARLGLPDLLVVTLGWDDPAHTFPVPVRQLGKINGQHRVALVTAAADLVVAPAQGETFGQSVVEAAACGTPALAYPCSGLQEGIRDGVTGRLAEDTEPESLAAAVQWLYAHPEERHDLARWGRLYVENEWSEFAASRSLYLALRSVDVKGRIRLGRMLRFRAEEPALPPWQRAAQCQTGWLPRQGFSGVMPAIPEEALGPHRWAYGPGAVAEVLARETGLHRILLAYRNSQEGQSLSVRCNGMDLGTHQLEPTSLGRGRMLLLTVPLEAGPNLLHLSFSKWDLHRDEQVPLAIIVTGILVEPVAACDRYARGASAEQMLAAVWGRETK